MEIARIRDVLSRQLGSDPEWSLIQIHQNQTPAGVDRVFRASTPGRVLAVKCNARSEKNRREFHALMHMQKTGVDCAQPILLAEDGSFYVMGWLEGADLRRRMCDHDRLDLIAAAARWLRIYHRRGARRLPARDHALTGPVLPGSTCAEGLGITARIDARRRALWLHHGPVASLHTDFQLQNLAHHNGRIAAYDPVAHRVGHVYFDVTRFLIGLALQREIAANGERAWPDDARADRRVFLRAYGGIPCLWRGQFEVIFDMQLARLWRNFASRHPEDRGALHRSRIIAGMMRARGLLSAA